MSPERLPVPHQTGHNVLVGNREHPMLHLKLHVVAVLMLAGACDPGVSGAVVNRCDHDIYARIAVSPQNLSDEQLRSLLTTQAPVKIAPGASDDLGQLGSSRGLVSISSDPATVGRVTLVKGADPFDLWRGMSGAIASSSSGAREVPIGAWQETPTPPMPACGNVTRGVRGPIHPSDRSKRSSSP